MLPDNHKAGLNMAFAVIPSIILIRLLNFLSEKLLTT
jgi:hypothetical protein